MNYLIPLWCIPWFSYGLSLEDLAIELYHCEGLDTSTEVKFKFRFTNLPRALS
jgi:hypothetical protein